MSDPAKYRTREEVDKVREHNDPIKRCEQRIFDAKFATEAELKDIDSELKAIVKTAADFSLESPEPRSSELYTDVLA